LRDCELEAALAETRADLAAGRHVAETAAENARRPDSEMGKAQLVED